MSISTTSVGGSLRGRLQAGSSSVGLAGHVLHGGAQVDAAAVAPVGGGLVAAAADGVDRQRQLLGQLLGPGVFGRGHGLEVGLLQPLAV